MVLRPLRRPLIPDYGHLVRHFPLHILYLFYIFILRATEQSMRGMQLGQKVLPTTVKRSRLQKQTKWNVLSVSSFDQSLLIHVAHSHLYTHTHTHTHTTWINHTRFIISQHKHLLTYEVYSDNMPKYLGIRKHKSHANKAGISCTKLTAWITLLASLRDMTAPSISFQDLI